VTKTRDVINDVSVRLEIELYCLLFLLWMELWNPILVKLLF